MSLSLAANTNKIIDDLLQRVARTEPLSDFERARFFREARNQPSLDREYSIKVLVSAIDKNREDVLDYVNRALHYLEQDATLTHCMYALHVVGLHEHMQKIFKENEDFFERISHVRTLGSSIAALPDLYYIDKILLTLSKAKKLEEAKEVASMSSYFYSNAEYAENEFGIQRKIVGQISKFASAVAGAHGNVVINNTRYEKALTGDGMNLTYFIEWNGTHLFDLNLALADLLIEHDLDGLPLVASFDLVSANTTHMKDMYANKA
ncbi:hypothetical protein C9980_12815 [Vibrio mediterranei]|uniref:hypothetical protein n=1 Tax=Vibrio mediterranei TaxID=689 RepID=UPI000D183126|nr:hypothetical protein [Vibrio mediterranei]PTC04333.1 hypothetical protein C9980_12815 [Vibrio mediterranei]